MGGAGVTVDAAPPVTKADTLVKASDSDRFCAVAAPLAPVKTRRIYHSLSLSPSSLSPSLSLPFSHLLSHLFSLVFALYSEYMNVGQHCTSLSFLSTSLSLTGTSSLTSLSLSLIRNRAGGFEGGGEEAREYAERAG
jgi:hypothetical protein